MKTNRSYKKLEDRIELLELQLESKSKEKKEVSDDFLGRIINNIGDPVFVKDDQSRMILVNDAFCNIFDLTREMIIGKTLAEDVPPDQRENFLKIDKQVLADGKESIIEEFLKVRDGELKTIVTKKSRYIDDSNNKLLIGVIHDITSNKLIEKELIQAKEQAEASEKLKSAFLANMSHEIRTPLNAILGFSNLLRKDNLPKEKKEKYLEIIESGGNRLLRIINDVLDLSKINANQLILSYKPCNLNQLIDNLREQFTMQIKDKEYVIKTNKGLSDSESIVLTDQTRLLQILSNLVENSLKYTIKGEVLIGYTKEGSMLKFFVKDTGIGVDPKYHKSVFARFTQVEDEYTKLGSGTGIGLPIVKELIELMKGEVWIESEKGKGSTFYFTIPYKIANEDNDPLNNIVTPTDLDADEVILIAEDEYINYLYLEALFENYPFKLLHAVNGDEAIKLAKNNSSIGLILMDMKMPKINGLEATKEIRKSNKTIPIIALTAYAFEEDKQKALNAGCNDYLTKPFDEKTLIEMVEKYRKGANKT
jgi:PAS domain S-box-containing protein